MSSITYRRQTLESGDVAPHVDFRISIPVWIDGKAAIRLAGFDPEKDRIGILMHEWRGHPEFALVVNPDSENLMFDKEFAVSEQSVYSLDTSRINP